MLIRPVRDDGIISWEIRLDVLIMSDYEVSIFVMDSRSEERRVGKECVP